MGIWQTAGSVVIETESGDLTDQCTAGCSNAFPDSCISRVTRNIMNILKIASDQQMGFQERTTPIYLVSDVPLELSIGICRAVNLWFFILIHTSALSIHRRVFFRFSPPFYVVVWTDIYPTSNWDKSRLSPASIRLIKYWWIHRFCEVAAVIPVPRIVCISLRSISQKADRFNDGSTNHIADIGAR